MRTACETPIRAERTDPPPPQGPPTITSDLCMRDGWGGGGEAVWPHTRQGGAQPTRGPGHVGEAPAVWLIHSVGEAPAHWPLDPVGEALAFQSSPRGGPRSWCRDSRRTPPGLAVRVKVPEAIGWIPWPAGPAVPPAGHTPPMTWQPGPHWSSRCCRRPASYRPVGAFSPWASQHWPAGHRRHCPNSTSRS